MPGTQHARHPHVVVIGSGFGGLFATKRLARADLDVTVVSSTPHHLFQPLLYQVATGVLSEGEVAPPLREVVRRRRNVTVLLGDVVDVRLAAREIDYENELGRVTLAYDELVVAAGSRPTYFGHDAFAAYAPALKSIDDALDVRGRIFTALELAETADDEQVRRRLLTFVVVGAGPTGVEVAGQVAELARRTIPRDYRRIAGARARVVLVDTAGAVLPGSDPRMSYWAERELRSLGVEVLLGHTVVDMDDDGVVLQTPDGAHEEIASACKVWAAGVTASPLGRALAEQSGVEVDRGGRLPVQPDLTLPGFPEVHVVGDMAALPGVPGLAPAAMQEGAYAADAIVRRRNGRPASRPFRYHDRGTLAIVSRFRAVARIGGVRLHGFAAWAAWLLVHLFYLVGFKNRVTAVVHWLVSFVGTGQAERTVGRSRTTERARPLPDQPSSGK